MENLIRSFFEKEKIEYFASCEIAEEYVCLKRKLPPFAKYVTMFLIPYKFGKEDTNISLYAVSRDYHFYIAQLKEALKKYLEEGGIVADFEIFADNSPFFERKLAKKLNLGFVGKNGLLINGEYGSFVFLAELVTSKELSFISKDSSRKECLSCMRCIKSCPSGCLSDGDFSQCMSALTQSKKLSEREERLVADHPYVWGCDICQEVCPHNKEAKNTPIEFFAAERIPYLTSELVCGMEQEKFAERAFAWRGKNVILRNLKFKNI